MKSKLNNKNTTLGKSASVVSVILKGLGQIMLQTLTPPKFHA
jgi:hypothetical protein